MYGRPMDAMEIVKLAGPLFTGGLAGAVLTQLRANRPKKRVRLAVLKLPFSLPKLANGAFSGFKVSFGDRVYESLVYYELVVRNTGTEAVTDNPVIITLADGAEVLEMQMVKEPENGPMSSETEHLSANQRRFHCGRLLPGDVARIRLLVNGADAITWKYRGEAHLETLSKWQPLTLYMGLMMCVFGASALLPTFEGTAQWIKGGIVVLAMISFLAFASWRQDRWESARVGKI